MTKKNLVIVGVLLILLAIFIGAFHNKSKNSQDETGDKADSSSNSETITVELKSKDNPEKIAKAMLENVEEKTKIILDLPDDVERMAFVRKGDCQNLGAVEYILASPQAGRSETMVDARLDDLKEKFPLSISLRQASDPSDSYYFCGELREE